MERVRSNSVLSLVVVQMREAGLSWREVKTAIEVEISRRDPLSAGRGPGHEQGRSALDVSKNVIVGICTRHLK